MRMIFFLLIFNITFSHAFSQKEIKTSSSFHYGNGSYVNLNVVSLLDVKLPTIQPGYEYKFNDRLGLEVAIGIPVAGRGDRKTDSTYHNFYKIRSSLKYYIKKDFFIGPEVFYTREHYARYDEVYYLGKTGGAYSSDYTVNKKAVVGIDFKAGFDIELGKKMYLEYFSGAGFRFVTIKLPVNINPHPLAYYPHTAYQSVDIVGTKTTPHLTVGFKLVYKL